jgi:uncharacterized protein (TIGR02099 family)
MFRRCFSLIWVIAVIALVGAAALLSVARTWLPQFGAQRAEVQRWVSQAVGQPVQIDALEAEWRGLYPVLHLRGVRLLDPDKRHTLLRFAELRVVVDPYAALYRWRVQVRALSVIGARLSVERRADGSLDVLGFEDMPDSKTDSMAVLAWLASQPELSLLRSEIHWHDARSAAPPLVFSAVDLQLENDGTRHKLAGATRLPQSLGSQLRCVIDFKGDFATPAQWSGNVYLHGTGLQLASWLRNSEYAHMKLQDGAADAELWGVFEGLQLRVLTGNVHMRKLRLAGDTTSALDEVSGRLRFLRDAAAWRVDVEDLHVVRGAQAWPVSGFSLRQRTLAGGAQQQFDADFDFLRLQDISALAMRGSLLPESAQAMLAGVAATGDVHDLRAQVRIRDDALESCYLKAHLAALSTHAWQRLPALSGVTGLLEGTDKAGRLQLDSHQFSVELPGMFRQPILLNRLSGDIEWQHYPELLRIQSERLQAGNADLQTETRFSLDLPREGKPFLDLQTRFTDGDVTAVPRYLPAHIMPPGVVTWLDRAFLGGRVPAGVALFHGRPADFPFDAHEGVFLVSADVENAGLDYGAGWPPIERIAAQVNFSGRSLRIDAASGSIFAAQLGPVQVGIADLHHGELQIDGNAQTSNADLLRFLAESPLSLRYRDTLAGLTAGGDSRLTLSLNLPLTPHEGVPLLLGRVDFKAGTLAFPNYDLDLKDISGPLDFTATGLFSTGLQANLFGNAVTITAQTQEKGPNAGHRFDLQGHVAIDTLAEHLPGAFWRLLDGGSDYQASLLFPLHATGPANLHIESALRGVTVRLPAPLAKSGKEARPFSIDMPLASTGHRVAVGSYGDVLRGAFELAETAGKTGLVRGELRFGGAPAQLPETAGLRIAGELEQFDLDAWRAALMTGKATKDELHVPDDFTALDVRVQEFKAGYHTLKGLHLLAERQPAQWQVDVDSDALGGRIQVPLQYPDDGPVVMALDHLKIEAGKDDSADDKPIDPRQLPALQLTAGKFEYHGADFGALTLNTTRSTTGMHVDKATVESPALKASASGDWSVDKATQVSRFSIDVAAPQLGLLLGKFGYVGNIKDGETAAKIQAEWPGSPARFAMERLQGSLHVDIKNGRFVDIEPGAGRVFGLLSINELQRRLRLDFSDLFKKGFTFDEISGDFMLSHGDAVTHNTVIKGPAARIDITGRTGLVRRDYEQLITVTPHLTSSLPLAGAIANPGIGAALFLAQKLFESQIDAITRYQYTVRGGWDKPVIERVSQQKPAEQNPP